MLSLRWNSGVQCKNMKLEDLKFSPQIKAKRFKSDIRKFKPFPTERVSAVFTGFSVDVFEKDSIRQLHENGFYGKGSHSRGAPKIIKGTAIASTKVAESLVLDLEEAFFLSHTLEILKVFSIHNQEKLLSSQELLERFCAIKENFPITFVAYLYLKSKNWVVKAGCKFGGDFLLYKSGPLFNHASFVVHVTSGQKASKDFQGIHRVAESSDKDVLILEVTPPAGVQAITAANFLNHLDKFVVSEIVARRLDYKEFVQVKS